MLLLRVVGAINIALGIFSLIAPVKFYSFAMRLFTPDVSPPFSTSAIKLTTFFFIIPSFILIINGVAFLFLGYYLEERSSSHSQRARREDLKEQEGYSLSYAPVKHEYLGMEVYDTQGNYHGRVVDVVTDSRGEVVEFTVKRGRQKKVFRGEDIYHAEEVILLRIK